MLFTVYNPLPYALCALSQTREVGIFMLDTQRFREVDGLNSTTTLLLKRWPGWYSDPSLLSTNRETKHLRAGGIRAPLPEAQRKAPPQVDQIIHPRENNSEGKSLGPEFNPLSKNAESFGGP